MNRTPVESSSIHSIGHDETGLEVQFHTKGCAVRYNGKNGDDKPCDCPGGDVFHYPGVPTDTYREMTAADSVGSYFARNIRNAKHPHTGESLYKGVKRDA